ncbi:MAG: glutathione S-transferase family protein [Myxococcales bacterium]|nr:glutathione S-transferase family protein [Myxococcales bacterium]
MKLYGTPGSRALRSIWAAEEVGVDYELIPTSFLEESKTSEYLAINPNGRIPALVDGDLVLFESMAINLYLAKTYGGKLYPSNPQDEARALQWTIWGMTELEPHLIPMVLHKMFLPEDQRDPAVVSKAEAEVERPLAVLDAHVSDREYLLGGDFTIADLNLAGALSTANFVSFDFSKFENASRWMSRCAGRPSFERARAK